MMPRSAAPGGASARAPSGRGGAGRRPKTKPERYNNTSLQTKTITTCNDGSLGSGIDEERSEMRYVM